MKYLIIIFSVLFSFNLAFSDILIEFQIDDKENNTKYNNKIYVSKNKFAIKSENDNQSVIFDGTKNVLKVINDDNKEYTELNKTDIDKIAAKINQMNKMMEQQLAQVPESQREQIKSMMESKMPSNEPVNINYEYKKTGETDNVNGYSVVKYEVFLNGEKDNQELWVTDYTNIDIQKNDFGSFVQFEEFLTEIFSSIGNMADIDYDMFWDFNDLDGFPVKTVILNETGDIEEINTLESINRNFNDNSVYNVPSGYSKKSLNLD